MEYIGIMRDYCVSLHKLGICCFAGYSWAMVDIKSVFDGENGLSKGSAVDAVFVSDDKVHILHILLT